jgi:predicted metalloprotease
MDLASATAILTDPPGCPGAVNTFWRQQLGAAWTPIKLVPYRDGQRPRDACGGEVADPTQFAENAFYCPQDDTIAYSEDLLGQLAQVGGPYLPVVVLEHEEGHRADRLGNHVGAISRSEENQADCDAGASTRFARNARRLPLTDVFNSASLLYQLGDRQAFGRERASDPGAHGTPHQRLVAFTRGYLQGLPACIRLGRSRTGFVV